MLASITVLLAEDHMVVRTISAEVERYGEAEATRPTEERKGKLAALGTIAELGRSQPGTAAGPASLEQIYLRYCQEDKPC